MLTQWISTFRVSGPQLLEDSFPLVLVINIFERNLIFWVETAFVQLLSFQVFFGVVAIVPLVKVLQGKTCQEKDDRYEIDHQLNYVGSVRSFLMGCFVDLLSLCNVGQSLTYYFVDHNL